MKKIILFILFISLLPAAYAWGIAYAQDHFVLKQGETTDVTFFMQNYVEPNTKRIVIELSGDAEIATIVDKQESYLLPPKTKDHEVIIRLQIPEAAKKEYEVEVNFIAHNSKGGVGISTAKVISLTVDVPDGNVAAESVKTELNLAKIYDELEEQKEKEEGEETSRKQLTGLTILKDPASSSKSLKVLLISLLALVGLVMSGYVFVSRKRRRNLEL